MKIFYKSTIAKLFTFLEGFSTIMLFGIVFTEKKESELSKRTENHESVHVFQYWTLFGVGLVIAIAAMFTLFVYDIQSWWMLSLITVPALLYYLWYLLEYFIRLAIYRDSDRAYRMISFEQEAYDLQYEYLKPCPERRTPYTLSFMRYYRK